MTGGQRAYAVGLTEWRDCSRT